MLESQSAREDFLKKLALIFTFFAITPIALIACTISLISVTHSSLQSDNVLGASVPYEPGVQIYASLPNDFPTISSKVYSKDAREEIIKEFLSKYDSPMKSYAGYIVEIADRYGIDWRLTTAIAMKESGLGKVMPYDNCNNAWGYGIHSEGTLCFDTWEEGIEIVSRALKEDYVDMGYETVDEIMEKYAHPNSTTWADGVNYYISQIK